MEVSSHAIDLHRVDGVRFAVAAFTNLTQDHLDYHHTLEEYFSVKRRLFTEFEAGPRAWSTIDDPSRPQAIAREVPRRAHGRGGAPSADVRAADEEPSAPLGAVFTLVHPPAGARVRAAARRRVQREQRARRGGMCAGARYRAWRPSSRGCEAAPQVPGRLERVDAARPFSVFVDYAHTPDSLEKAIAAVRDVTERPRDRGVRLRWRPRSRQAAAHGPGRGVAAPTTPSSTSDNPRSEDPVGIILQIEDGLQGTPAPTTRSRSTAAAPSRAPSTWPSRATPC